MYSLVHIFVNKFFMFLIAILLICVIFVFQSLPCQHSLLALDLGLGYSLPLGAIILSVFSRAAGEYSSKKQFILGDNDMKGLFNL